MSKKKKRRVLPIAIVCCVAVVAFGAYSIMGRGRPASASASLLTAKAERGSITSTVVGTGTLGDEDGLDIELPTGLKVDSIPVKAGDSVQKGDVLATFDEASVSTAITAAQDELAEIDRQINSTKDDTESEKIKTYVSGRIKRIYPEKEDSVAAVMQADGALALLSIDGRMAVSFEAQAELSVDDEVDVYLPDGSKKTGTVRQYSDGQCTVTITDNGPELDDAVTIKDKDGNEIGAGTLDINQPVAITGVSGTVKTIHYKENSSVSSGTTLFTLKDMPKSSENRDLMQQRADAEQKLQTLVDLSGGNTLVADFDGTVQSINIAENTATGDASAQTASATTQTDASAAGQTGQSAASAGNVVAMSISTRDNMILTAEIDELDILSIQPGQKAGVVLDALPDKQFDGEISHISDVGNATGGITKYSVEITMQRTDEMRSGMNATATIVISETDEILVIPIAAIQEDGSRIFVYTASNDDGLAGEKEIQTGVSDDAMVEITGGLSEGETVYYEQKQATNAFEMMQGGMMGGGNRSGEPRGGADQ